MEFKVTLSETQAAQIIQLLELAVRSGGIQTARIAIPIVDDLARQADAYNKNLVPAPKQQPTSEPEVVKS